MEDLEDSVGSLPRPAASAGEQEVAQKPRRLGRLRKAGALENAQPNRAAGASPAQLADTDAQQAADGDQQAVGRSGQALSSPAAATAGDGGEAAAPSPSAGEVRLAAACWGDRLTQQKS